MRRSEFGRRKGANMDKRAAYHAQVFMCCRMSCSRALNMAGSSACRCAAVRLCSAIDSPLPPICRRPSARESCCRLSGFFIAEACAFRFRTKTPTHIKEPPTMSDYKFETLPASRRPGTGRLGSRAVPIYQTTSYVFRDFRPCRRSFRLCRMRATFTAA